MGICNYCKEEIKDEALKCKHCGEWVDSKSKSFSLNSITDFTKSTFGNLKRLKEDTYGKGEIMTPTNDSPLILENKFVLYPDHIRVNGEKYDFDNITRVINKYSVETFNGATTRYSRVEISFSDFDEKNMNFILNYDNSGSLLNLKIKNVKICRSIGVYLEKITFENRLKLYLNELSKGRIDYINDVIIHHDGYISRKNTKLNLKTSNKNNQLWIGLKKGSLAHTGSVNPYEIRIKENKGIFEPKIQFEAIMDYDVIVYIIESFVNDNLKIN